MGRINATMENSRMPFTRFVFFMQIQLNIFLITQSKNLQLKIFCFQDSKYNLISFGVDKVIWEYAKVLILGVEGRLQWGKWMGRH